MKLVHFSAVLLLLFIYGGESLTAQETPPAETSASQVKQDDNTEVNSDKVVESVKETTEEAIKYAEQKTEEISRQIDDNKQAKEYSAGILQPIYALAEYMSFPLFHWLAFALMVSGVVSFALQLVLAKLAVLAHGGLSISQILTDAQGLLLSVVGLVLTTQAATENSVFTTSAGAVLSASAVGAVAGFMFYLWGQSEELQALKARKLEAKQNKPEK